MQKLDRTEFILRSILAGLLIAVACDGYLTGNIASSIWGAVLFTIGLLTICIQGLKLFTGNIGNFRLRKYSAIDMALMFAGNIVGISIAALLCRYFDPEWMKVQGAMALRIAEARFAQAPEEALLRSMGCGMLVQCAVQNYKSNKSAWGVMLPTAVFITLGFNHCIADVFYYVVANRFAAITWTMTVLGNIVGAWLYSVASRDN